MSLLYLKMYLFKQESPKRFFPLTIIEITGGKDKLVKKSKPLGALMEGNCVHKGIFLFE
jgi:hypothetical protein